MRKVISILCLLAVSGACGAATISVDIKGGAGFSDIQSAIDAASGGDTVLVKPGEYVIVEPIDFNRHLDLDVLSSPPVKDIRLASENGPGETTIRMSPDPKDPLRASVIVFEHGEGRDSAVEGFRLTGGGGSSISCTLGDCDLYGGGILFTGGSSPTITNCIIAENSSSWGGGIHCLASSPALNDCSILRNWATKDGGGIHIREGSSASFIRCNIEENAPSGAYCHRSSPTFSDCRISRNIGGSGFRSDGSGCSPVLSHCEISSNSGLPVCDQDPCPSAGVGGGFLFDDLSSPVLTGCTISGNAAYRGGGLLGRDEASITLVNCAVWGNLAQEEGGCISASSVSLVAMNCTLVQNDSGTPGDGFSLNGGSFTLTNCILWENGLGEYSGTTSYCLTGADPLFVKPGVFNFGKFTRAKIGDREYLLPDFAVEAPDYRLRPGSPAIDLGTPHGAPAIDIADQVRPCGDGVDIGAHEHGGCAPPRMFIRGDLNASGAPDIGDIIFYLYFQFLGVEGPTCLEAADVDDNDVFDITDAIYSLQFQFLGGSPPPGPFPGCGIEQWIDQLDCREYTGCR